MPLASITALTPHVFPPYVPSRVGKAALMQLLVPACDPCCNAPVALCHVAQCDNLFHRHGGFSRRALCLRAGSYRCGV